MKAILSFFLVFFYSMANAQTWEVHSWGKGSAPYFNDYYSHPTNFIFDKAGNIYKVQPGKSYLIAKNDSVYFAWESIVKLSPEGSILWKVEVTHKYNNTYQKSIQKLSWSDDSTIAGLGISQYGVVIDTSHVSENICFLLSLHKDAGKIISLVHLFNFGEYSSYEKYLFSDMLITKEFVLLAGSFDNKLFFYENQDTIKPDPFRWGVTNLRPILLCFNRSGKRLWSKVNGSPGNRVYQTIIGNINIINSRIITTIVAGNEKDSTSSRNLAQEIKYYILVRDSSGTEVSRHYFNQNNNADYVNDERLLHIWDALKDKEGNLYVTGSFADTLTFEGFTYVSASSKIFPLPVNNFFLLKLNAELKVSWIKVSEGNYDAKGYVLAVDGENNVQVYGKYWGEKTFEGIKTDVQPNNQGLFLVSYKPDGSIISLRSPANAQLPFVGNMGIDPCDNIYLSGYTNASFLFDSGYPKISFGSVNLKGLSREDISFMVRYKPAHIGFEPKKICPGDYVDPTGDTSYNTFNWVVDDTIRFNTRKWIMPALSTGRHKVSLNAVSSKGCTTFFTDTITVSAKPQAAFNANSSQACQYSRVFFTDSSKADTISSIQVKSWQWSWGDGTDTLIKGATGSVFHTYKSSGIFQVSLVFSNGICSDSIAKINAIIIIPAPAPGFVVNNMFGCLPFSLIIQDTITDVVSKSYFILNMNTGDSMLFNDKGLQHDAVLEYEGKYRIAQSLAGTTGCISVDTQYVTVVKGFSLKDTITMINVTYINDSTEIGLNWEADKRSVSHNVFADGKHAGKTRGNSFVINSTAAKHDFFITGTDTCGNSSAPSKTFSNVFLSVTNHHNQFFILTYTAFQQWENGVREYQVESNSPAGWQVIAKNSGSGIFKDDLFSPADELNILYRAYRIMAHENAGNKQVSQSNTVYVPYEPMIFVPNAFTPNGDGLNDTFIPTAIGISVWRLKIFNRWGEKIYDGETSKGGWDGTFNKEVCGDGIYIYSIDWTGNSMLSHIQKESIKGTLQLLRF